MCFRKEYVRKYCNQRKTKGIKNIDTKVDAAYQNMHALQKEIEQLKNQIFALKSNEWVNETVSLGSVNALIKKLKVWMQAL